MLAMSHSDYRDKILWQRMLDQSFSPLQWFSADDKPSSDGDGEADRSKIMWVYRPVAAGKYAVGFYTPDKEWVEDGRYITRDEAALRVHWLNGGGR